MNTARGVLVLATSAPESTSTPQTFVDRALAGAFVAGAAWLIA